MILFLLPAISTAQPEPDLFFGLGIIGITSDRSIQTGYSMTLGVLKNRFGFSNSIGYTESNETKEVRSATFLAQPLFMLKQNFFVGFGPQPRIKSDDPIIVGYAGSVNFQAADILLISASWSKFEAFGLSLNLLF